MTRTLIAALLLLAGPAYAGSHALSDTQLEQIAKLMADLRCEVNGEIEVEDGTIELDDVICAGGQFDIELNSELHIVGARPE